MSIRTTAEVIAEQVREERERVVKLMAKYVRGCAPDTGAIGTALREVATDLEQGAWDPSEAVTVPGRNTPGLEVPAKPIPPEGRELQVTVGTNPKHEARARKNLEGFLSLREQTPEERGDGERVALLHQLIGEWFAESQIGPGAVPGYLHDYLGVTHEDYVSWVQGRLSSAELYDRRTPSQAG